MAWARKEDGARRQIDASTAGPGPTTTEAMASTLAGGLAYLAALGRRLAPDGARSASRPRALTERRGWRRAAERQHRWHVAAIGGGAPPRGLPPPGGGGVGGAGPGRRGRRPAPPPPLGGPPRGAGPGPPRGGAPAGPP